MKYKADWPDVQKRLSALWHGEMLDRPCIAVMAPAANVPQTQRPVPASAEAKWMDPDYLTATALYDMEHTWWGGEAIPSTFLQAGWVNCLGGTPLFNPDTIWFDRRTVDFGKPSQFRMRLEDHWVRRYRAAFFAVADAAGWDDFFMGSPSGGLPANDLLSMQMGTDNFLMALMDEPEWMAEAILRGAQDQLKVQKQLQEQLRQQHAYWYGNAGWMSLWAPEPYLSMQSDVSCMMSPEMFDRFVLPEIDMYGQEFNALWYHLDGRDAKQHLPRLLSLPYMKVIQYVPTPAEPPNGPGHLELYRAIQKADRIVHIDVPLQYVEPLLRELDPGLIMMQTHCPSVEAGEELLERSAQWARHKSI